MSDQSIEETLRRNAEVVAQADRMVARLRESSAQASEVAERARAALGRIVAERDAYKAALEEIAKWGADREQHAARSDLSRDEERGWNLALSGLEYRARSVLAGVVSTREKDDGGV